MAKRNVQNSKKVVEKPVEELNGITDTTEQINEPQGAAVEETVSTENVQEELPIQPEQNNGEQPDDAPDSELDTEDEATEAGEKGSETDDTVTDESEETDTEDEATEAGEKGSETDDTVTDESEETTEQRNRIADDVFAKNSQCKELHFTSDLVPFFLKSDAVRHAATLDDDTIVTINKV